MQIKDNRVFHSPALSKVRRLKMLSCSWTAPASRLECSVRLRKVAASVMAVAASLRSGACRSRSSGPTARSRGFFCGVSPRSDTRGAVAAGGRLRVRTIADGRSSSSTTSKNLLAVIGSGLRLLECQRDSAHRNALVGKMQEALTRGALRTQQLLDTARPCPEADRRVCRRQQPCSDGRHA
jgi:hypothetical protein